MTMWLVRVLNDLSSQGWAFVLIILGMSTFSMACHCLAQDVRAALMTSATGMIAAGIAMFQHQTKSTAGTATPAIQSQRSDTQQ
jgi:hypothetical protein